MDNKEFDNLLADQAIFLKPFAVNLTRNPDAADDLYQETLYKALANQEKYRTGTNIKAWLYTIMRNIFINDYRRNARRKTVGGHTAEDYLLNSKQAAVPNGAENRLREKEIKAAVEALPNAFKIPFQLYFEGYKYQEIAEYLDEPLGTVKSRIHFARKLLKEQLSRY